MLALGGELIDTAAAQGVALPSSAASTTHPSPELTHGAKRKGRPRPRYERQMAICRECATAAVEHAGEEAPTFVALIDQTAA
jgi:hypothetical protein